MSERRIAVQDRKIILRDKKVGIGLDCCCCTGCLCCKKACCLTVEERDTCQSGTELIAADPNIIVVNWGSEVFENGATIGSYQYLSDDFDLLVEFVWLCEDGVLSLDIELSEWIPGNAGVGDPAGSYRRWANASAILGEDGCPTGVDLGEPTETGGPEPTNMPTFGWICT